MDAAAGVRRSRRTRGAGSESANHNGRPTSPHRRRTVYDVRGDEQATVAWKSDPAGTFFPDSAPPSEIDRMARKPSFEESLQRLESIVESIEQGKIGLEESIRRFEEGMQLIKSCRSFLTEAELKIQTLHATGADGLHAADAVDSTLV